MERSRRLSWKTGFALGLIVILAVAQPGCLSLDQRGQSLVPMRSLTRLGPYRIWTHEPIPDQEPAIRALGDLERQLQAQLAVRVDPDESPVEIYILKDRKAFEQFLTFYYPELPQRRAFFLAQGNRRLVYTYAGAHLIEDLRHEVTHALLHASMSNLPLWLDEGLAEYFEVGDANGVNTEHLDRLTRDLAAGWKPDLVRLETLTDVRRMSSRDYRESWGWVHYLLRGPSSAKGELLAYLADVRGGQTTRPISARLDLGAKGGAARLIAHVNQTRERAIAAVPTTRSVIVRGQNEPLDDPLVVPRRRTLFDRFLGVLGL